MVQSEADPRTYALIENLPDAVNVFDRTWRWTFMNREGGRLARDLGMHPDDLAGKVLWNVFPMLADQIDRDEAERAMDSGTVLEREVFLPRLERWLNHRVIPAGDEFIVISRDVTSWHQAADERRFAEELNEALAAAPLGYTDALESLARWAVPRLADYCSIDVQSSDGRVVRVAAAHRDPEKEPVLREMWARFPYRADAAMGSPRALRTGAAQLTPAMSAEQVEAFAQSPEHLHMLRVLDPRSYIAVPIPGDTAPLGVVALVMSDSGRTMTDYRLHLATQFAERAAVIMRRATAYQETQHQREAASARAAWFEFLATAGDALTASLDVERTLQQVARAGVPRIADWAVVHLVNATGVPRQVAVAHVDPDKIRLAREFNEKYPPNPAARTGVAEVIRTGKSQLYPRITDEMLRATALDDEHLAAVRSIGFVSALIVPISAHGKVLGAITLVTAEGERRLDQDDLRLAEELGRRAGLAIEHAELYRQAERARTAAVEANEAKSSFLATMSHEIRTPINAVLGYAQLMEMGIAGPLTPQQREQIDRIVMSSTHLLSLVNELLDLAKVESGTLAIESGVHPVGETVDAAVSLLRPQAAARGVMLVESCEGDRDALFRGDAHRVRQIVTNLVGNAVKFTPAGGRVWIACVPGAVPPASASVANRGDALAIRVSDTGMGIPADQLDRVFEPFVQGSTGYTREQPGTGLGLAISRRLARLMGGDVTLESEQGAGSAFTLWLPRAGGESEIAGPAPIPMSHDGELRSGLEAVSAHLLGRVPDILGAWRDSIRADGRVPTRMLADAQLDDHAATFLTDVALALRVVGAAHGSGADPSGLIRDSMTILRTIAEQHGRQRQRLGWDAEALLIETEMLADETIKAMRDGASAEVAREAEVVVREFFAQTERLSLTALHAAAAESRA